MDKITRTLTATTVRYSEAVVENGIPTFRQCPDEVVPGEGHDTAKLLQHLQRRYGTHRSFLITGTSTNTQKYEMDLTTFIANATPVGGERENTSSEPQPTGSASQPTEPVSQPQPDGGADASNVTPEQAGDVTYIPPCTGQCCP